VKKSHFIRDNDDSNLGHVFCNGSTFYIYDDQKTPVSLAVPVSNVLRIHVPHCSYVMKRKPCLHEGTLTIDPNKNRLVEIPPSYGELPDDEMIRLQ